MTASVVKRTRAERRERQAESLATLRALLQPGQSVYVSTKQTSGSGMSRHVTVHVIAPTAELRTATSDHGYDDGDQPDPRDYELRSITWDVANALGWPLLDGYDTWRIRLDGVGMDMHFHLVYSLGMKLWSETHVNAGYLLEKVSI